MARIRTIKPEFPHSESMGRVSRDARLTFIELWTLCDDEGRARGNARMLSSLLFPYDDDAPKKIDGWLKELEDEGCIVRYQFDGNSYIQVINWLCHQKIDRPSTSKIPSFENVREDSRGFASESREAHEDSSLDQGRDQGREGKGRDSSEPHEAASKPAESAAMNFPVVGNGKKEWPLMFSKIREYQDTYKGVDVLSECRTARQWCIDNPTKRKTANGMFSFLNRWLSRAQNDSGKIPAKINNSENRAALRAVDPAEVVKVLLDRPGNGGGS